MVRCLPIFACTTFVSIFRNTLFQIFALSYFIFPCSVAWSWIKRCVRARTVFGNRWAWRVYVQLDGGNPEERARRGRVIFIVAMMFLALALLSDPAPSKQAAAQAAAAEAEADAPPPVRGLSHSYSH